MSDKPSYSDRVEVNAQYIVRNTICQENALKAVQTMRYITFSDRDLDFLDLVEKRIKEIYEEKVIA